MKIRNKNGRIQAAFSAFDTLPGLRISATFHSLFGSTINPLDKYCPDLLRRQIGAVSHILLSRTRCSASSAVHRRAGTVPDTGVRYGPGSAAHRSAKSYALRCVRGTRTRIQTV